jgi:hypothetical protein
MIDALPDTMAGTRNKALLPMGYDILAAAPNWLGNPPEKWLC